MYSYEVRPLASFGWPHGLGKGDYPELRDAMKNHLRAEYNDPAANHRAFSTDAGYREIAERWLTEADWSSTIVEVVTAATALARDVPLLGQPVEEDQWLASTKTYLDQHGIAYGARWHGGPYVAGDYLQQPMGFSAPNDYMDDGRHRLTYLRLMERIGAGPSEILVKIQL